MKFNDLGIAFKRIAFPLAAALLLWTGGLTASELDLDNAVGMALRENETYLSGLQDKLKAEGEITAARAAALPSLTFDFGYTRNLEIPEIVIADQRIKFGSKNDYRASLTLDQTLFSGQVLNALKIAKLYDRYAGEGVRIARQQVILETKREFYAAILAQDNVNVYKDAVAQAERNLEVVKSLYREGLVSEFDKLRAEVELANLGPQLTKAENEAAIALNGLKYYIGYTGIDKLTLKYDFKLEDTLPSPDLNRAIQDALISRPEYVGQEYMIKAYKQVIGIARSGRMPSLYFSTVFEYDASLEKTIPDRADWTKSWSASLNLSFPIFDGLETSGGVKKAKADFVKSRLARSQIEDAIRLEVEAAVGSIDESKRRLASGQRTINMAEEGLRVADLRFKNGIGTQLEILSAQAALTQAKTNYVFAIYDYQIAVAQYYKAIGLDLYEKKE